jgi:hypothetical protein
MVDYLQLEICTDCRELTVCLTKARYLPVVATVEVETPASVLLAI